MNKTEVERKKTIGGFQTMIQGAQGNGIYTTIMAHHNVTAVRDIW